MLSQDVAANVCTKSSSFSVASTAPSVLKTRGAQHRSRVLSDTVFAMVANRLTEPSSKRRTITEWLASVALPAGVTAPSLDQCYRAIDALCRAQGGHRGPSLLRAVQPREPGPAPGLLRPHLELLRDGRRRAEGLPIPRLRLQPRSPIRPAADHDRPPRHLRRHPDRPSRLLRQHGRCLDAAGGDGGPEVPLRRRPHRPCRGPGPHLRGQPGPGRRPWLRPRAGHASSPRRRR